MVLDVLDRPGGNALRWDQSGHIRHHGGHTENWTSFIGLLFMLIVLFFPRGVLGLIRRKVMT
jgi:ABC-type branched-subunit amino acid transport system permease subunit